MCRDLYDTEKSIREMGDFLAPYLEYGDIRIKIIAYRPMGVGSSIPISRCRTRSTWHIWQIY